MRDTTYIPNYIGDGRNVNWTDPLLDFPGFGNGRHIAGGHHHTPHQTAMLFLLPVCSPGVDQVEKFASIPGPKTMVVRLKLIIENIQPVTAKEGRMAEWLRYWTLNHEIVGFESRHTLGLKSLGKICTPNVPGGDRWYAIACLSRTSWYKSKFKKKKQLNIKAYSDNIMHHHIMRFSLWKLLQISIYFDTSQAA